MSSGTELKLVLKVKGVQIELSPQEAVELRDALDKVTGRGTQYVPYVVPYKWDVWRPIYEQYPVVYCSSTNNVSLEMTSDG